MKKSIILLVTLIFAITVQAYDFESEGIFYRIVSQNEVVVTFKSDSDRVYGYQRN